MSVEIIKLLRKTPIFSTLESSSLKKISGFFKEKSYSSGETLFKEGTLGDTLYIIKQGTIKISQVAKEGEEEISRALRREGDIFGESGFLDESPRPATAQATKITKVLQLSRSDFLTILNDHPLIAYQIVKVLSSRLKQSDLRVIEELKEKNEQLQQAYRALQETVKMVKSQEWSDESSGSIGERESFSDRLLSSVPYPVVCTREDDVIFFFNKAAEKEFGYKSEEIKGKPVKILWNEASWARLSPAIQEKLRNRSMWRGEIIAKKKNGEHFLSFTAIAEILDTQGKNDGKLYISQNVTQKRRQEQEERVQEELASRRQIIEEIANTMGREVKMLSDAFETLPLELDEINLSKSLKTLTHIRNALDNIKGLISDLSASPALEVNKEPLDLVSFFGEELLLLKSHEKFRDIIFATHFEEDTPKVKANKRQLQQLLYAILDNAASALQPVSDRTRTITIEVGGVNQKQEVQIQISDNGIGISASDLSNIFKEPFTTKRSGTGLRLLSVARIVKNHGGSIEVYSDEGSYTLFVIKLPAYEERKAFLPQAEPALRPQS